MDADRPATALPAGVAALLEIAVERLDAAVGTREVWLRVEDGRVRKYRIVEEGGREELARFDRERDHAKAAPPPTGGEADSV